MKTRQHKLRKLALITLACLIIPALAAGAEDTDSVFSLQDVIDMAIAANLSIKSSKEELNAALATKKQSRTGFFPTFNATYQYKRNDDDTAAKSIFTDLNEYNFSASFTQPLFAGFGIINQYKMAGYGLEIAEANEQFVRQNVILQARSVYFTVLKAEKLLQVTLETENQIEAQKDVAKNFYEVGMSPLNDLLQAQVELANATQEVILAKNDLEKAVSNLNILLRRPINSPVKLEDIQDFSPFEHNLEYCLQMAEENRVAYGTFVPSPPGISGNGAGLHTASRKRTADWPRPPLKSIKRLMMSVLRSSRPTSEPGLRRSSLPQWKPPSNRPRKTFASMKNATRNRWPHPPMCLLPRHSFPEP